jgi:hypothetical protein
MSLWKKKLEERRAAAKMVVEEVGLSSIAPWLFGIMNGIARVEREDKKFFQVLGMMIYGAGREVAGWGQPMMKEAGSGVYVIVTNPQRTAFLVTMREEPGNPSSKKHVLLGPPLQASLGNWTQGHGGKRPPRAEFYDQVTTWIDAPKDGGRFVNVVGENINQIGILELETLTGIPLEKDELVLTRAELKEAFLLGELNPYMREAGMALL